MRWFWLIPIVAVLYLIFRPNTASEDAGGAASSAGQGTSPLDDLVDAITRFEGGDNLRINNPGNLHVPSSGQWYPGQIGVTTDASGEANRAIFADLGDGYTALYGKLGSMLSAHPQWDAYDFTHQYVTGDTNSKSASADNYAGFISDYIGINPSESLYQQLYGG